MGTGDGTGGGEGSRGRVGRDSETHTYLVREVWPVGMMSESHFDDKVKVTPSRRFRADTRE